MRQIFNHCHYIVVPANLNATFTDDMTVEDIKKAIYVNRPIRVLTPHQIHITFWKILSRISAKISEMNLPQLPSQAVYRSITNLVLRVGTYISPFGAYYI